MRSRRLFLVVFIAFMMVIPILFSSGAGGQNYQSKILSSGNYTENLSVYLTSSDSLWKVNLSGGNINVSSVSVPSSVSGYSITLTNFASWQSSYELFTKYGFGLLGNIEPYPDGAVLSINGSSSSDAASLANSLGQQFGLSFVQTNSTATNYQYFSPINFATMLNLYFYSLIPQSAGGFATIFTESQLSSNDLNFYQLSYTSSTYSITVAGLTGLSSDNFTLYNQLGLTQTSYNYSSIATSSTIDIYVLGGLINNASEPYTNHVSNISSTIELSKSANSTVPDISASLDFAFPTIVAYRQITPTLDPSSGSSVTATITVSNVSPIGGATADNVFVNDSWIDSQSSSFHLTQTQTSNNETLAPGASYTVIYAFTVTATSGTFTIPATPVTYEYQSSANQTAHGEALLNPETIVVGASNSPQLEATASISGTIQTGEPYSVNVTIVNKGTGTAFSLSSDGLTDPNLQVGSSWSYISNQSSSSLTQINASLSYSVSWQDASGASHSTSTNTINTILGFATPGSPALFLNKTVSQPVSGVVNVTLAVTNNSPTNVTGTTINDTIPTGMTFLQSYNSSSIHTTGSAVNANLSSIAAGVTENFVYSLNVTNPNDNYLFLPASASTSWNGETITHYSGGFGLPLGVVATKVYSEDGGFPGSNVSITIGLVNHGSLPIYQVDLNNSYDSFLSIVTSNSSSAAVLNTNGSLSALLNANLTGAPGVYNSSSSAASFIFAGTSQTATSPVVRFTIFQLPEANLTYSATKVEEGHDIVIIVTITNPSNVTITNISYTLTLPKEFKIVSGGMPTFNVQSLGPNSTYVDRFTVITNQPDLYMFNNGKLTFEYQGHQINGIAATLSLSINDDIPLRYGVPVVIGLIIVIGTLFYVRRLTTAAPETTTKK